MPTLCPITHMTLTNSLRRGDRAEGAVNSTKSQLSRGRRCPLVDERQFIHATRDTGYRSTEAAVAELVDNALEAGAQRIEVTVEREEDGSGLRLQVLDDGCGMDTARLANALRFGGSERFDSRTSLGRFGMGLPNSSVSQARRVDVFSWQRRGAVRHAYMDVDEIATSGTGLPRPRDAALPASVKVRSRSGTLVVWTRCDRIVFRRASTVSSRLREAFARWYRYAIWAGVELLVNGEMVHALDPLYSHPSCSYPSSEPYGHTLEYPIHVPGTKQSSIVRIRFIEIPVEAWAESSVDEKRAAGIIGGPTVSVVRAGREIDAGWHLMGGKRRENYDDWWRCEVRFEPDLDELFGVTHNKQGVSPTPLLRAILSPDLEPIARTLNARVRKRFAAAKTPLPTVAARRATARDPFLPHPRTGNSPVHGLGYRISTRALGTDEFFRPERSGDVLAVAINTDHPFFERVYAPCCASPDATHRFGVEAMLLAAARALLDLEPARAGAGGDGYRTSWSDALAAFLT